MSLLSAEFDAEVFDGGDDFLWDVACAHVAFVAVFAVFASFVFFLVSCADGDVCFAVDFFVSDRGFVDLWVFAEVEDVCD